MFLNAIYIYLYEIHKPLYLKVRFLEIWMENYNDFPHQDVEYVNI